MNILFFTIFVFLSGFKICLGDNSVIALMYHRFNDERYPSTSISTKNFADQIDYLVSENFKILPLSDLVSFFKGKNTLPDKSVFITIDDGYKSFFENGFPILKEKNLPFSLFLSTKFVSNDSDSDFMNWEMIEELYKNKGEILNHTAGHKKLLNLEIEKVKKEIVEAEKKINSKILSPKILSYPYGESNKRIQELVFKLGYDIAFSQHSSPLHIGENRFNLPRFSINDEFGGMVRFKQIVNSKPLLIEDLKILKKNIATGEFEISFKLLVNSKNMNCYINNNAIIKRKKNKNYVNLQFSNLVPENRYRLNCTLFNARGELYWLGKMMTVTEMDIIF
jgi:peptidoglycan/xylan/chitin deacetylase (PgdA/CDA1 family)